MQAALGPCTPSAPILVGETGKICAPHIWEQCPHVPITVQATSWEGLLTDCSSGTFRWGSMLLWIFAGHMTAVEISLSQLSDDAVCKGNNFGALQVTLIIRRRRQRFQSTHQAQ